MFRYRAWNVNGAGEFSDTAYLIAAAAPARPPAPEYGSSTSTELVLYFSPSTDDNGLIITSMTLEIAAIGSESWAVVSDTITAMSHTMATTHASSPISSNSKYRFRLTATNAYGTSEASEELVVAIAPLPSKFDAVTKDQT
mmetsp:Transcript_23476/g.36165  ORF Transcript_23476/g.36165 Transcript_23476/m.36165 type:complete len:141 (-) Transcript_23476:5601-6023(-)